jgi:hypothetical protein
MEMAPKNVADEIKKERQRIFMVEQFKNRRTTGKSENETNSRWVTIHRRSLVQPNENAVREVASVTARD